MFLDVKIRGGFQQSQHSLPSNVFAGCAVETFELGGIGRLCFGCLCGLMGFLTPREGEQVGDNAASVGKVFCG